MSGHCHGDANDHDHDSGSDLGPRDNLYSQVDLDNVVALNSAASGPDNGRGSVVIKQWDQRLDETKFLVSDADDQLILRIPFVNAVKLRALLLKTGPSEHTPSKVMLYPNTEIQTFDDIADTPAAQEFAVAQGREVGQYNLKTAKFTNTSTVTLFFPSSQGADTVQIYYVGFLGTWSKFNKTPVITLYEAQANPADHEKIYEPSGGSLATS